MRFAPLAAPAAKSDRRPTAKDDRFDALSRGVNFHSSRKAAADSAAGLDDLHPRVRSVADRLSPVARKMLDYAVRQQEQKPALGITLHPLDVAQVLSVKSDEAEAARTELVRAGYLNHLDDGFGSSGYSVSDTNLR